MSKAKLVSFIPPFVAGIIIYLGCCSVFGNTKIYYNHLSVPQLNTSVSLKIFVTQVLENNPAIQAADAAVIAAHARSQAAKYPLYNPTLITEGQQSVDSNYTVGINQTVDWVNKRGARAQVGATNLLVAQAQRDLLYQQLTAEILNALVRYQAAQRVVSLAKERTNLMQQFVVLTEKRHANGDVARVDVDLAQLALSEAYAQQADAEVNLSQALQILRAITGKIQFTWPRLPKSLPNFTLTYLNVDHLIHQLPQVEILNNQFLSAQARIRLAQRERYPDPTFGLQGGAEKTPEKNGGLIGVSLSMPLYIRNPYRAEVDAANYDACEAEQKLRNVLRQMRAEIVSSAERYQTLYQRVQQWQTVSSKPLKDGITLLERMWQAGEISTTDYLIQLKQRIDSQVAGVELQSRAWQTWIEWLKASGT